MRRAKSNRGEALEQAVRTIETAVLKSLPAASRSTLRIETRKIIVVDGVKHEVDVWVHVDPGGGYDTLVVFECKDRKTSVGKNDVVVLADKLNASGATRGYLIGRRFSRYAVARAKLDRRIELLRFATEIPILPVLLQLHGIVRDPARTVVMVSLVSEDDGLLTDSANVRWSDLPATIDGTVYPTFQDYLMPIVKSLVDERLATERTHEFPAGEYAYEIAPAFRTVSGTVGELRISRIEMQVSFTIEVVRPPIVSVFAVEKRGRVYTTEIFRAAGQYVSIQYVAVTAAPAPAD